MNLKNIILSVDDSKTVPVDVPEWGVTVHIKTITGTERDAFESGLVQGQGKARRPNLTNLRARLVVLCAVDETGARIFGAEDVEALGAKAAGPLDRLFGVAQELNGLTEKDVENLGKD